MLVYQERGNPENAKENLSVQKKEPTNSIANHIWHRVWNRTLATLVGGHCDRFTFVRQRALSSKQFGDFTEGPPLLHRRGKLLSTTAYSQQLDLIHNC